MRVDDALERGWTEGLSGALQPLTVGGIRFLDPSPDGRGGRSRCGSLSPDGRWRGIEIPISVSGRPGEEIGILIPVSRLPGELLGIEASLGGRATDVRR